MGDQEPKTGDSAGFSYPIPKGLGDLNYLQSLLKSQADQELNQDSAPTFLSLTLTSLTASLLVGTGATKNLISITPGASLSLSGTTLNTIQNIRTTDGPTFAGLTLTTGAGLNKVWTSDAGGLGSWATPALAPAAHVLDGALHTVSGLTGGHFLKATGATTFGFAAHGLTYSDVGAEASGAVATHSALTTGVHGAGASTVATVADIATHAALITGVHGLIFTAGKTLTLTESLTLNALPIGGLAVATGANTLGSLAVGLTTQVLIGGGAGTVPGWSTDLPTAVTIGSGYVYRAGGTDVAVADGGTNLSSYAVGDILYASAATTISKLAGVAAGQPLLSGGVVTAPAYAGYTFSATAAQTYTFPSATCTLLATTGSPAAMVIASQATGDLLYASSATAWARLAIGAAGKALIVNAGGTLPEWGTVLTNPMDDAGQLIYGGVSGAPTKLAAGATTTILVGGGAAAPVWTTATGTGAPVRAGSPTFTTQITSPQILAGIGGATSDQLRIGVDTTNYYKIGRNTTTGHLNITGTEAGYIGLVVNGLVGVNTSIYASTVALSIKGTGATSATYNILSKDSADSTLFWLLDNGYVYIKSRLGIGVVSNLYKVEIRGEGTTASTYPFVIRNATPTTLFVIDDAGGGYFYGNIGVAATVASTIRIFTVGSGTGTGTYTILCRDSNLVNTFYVRDDGAGYLKAAVWTYSDTAGKENIVELVGNGCEK